MSFNTQPTRINELLVDSDQTWVSRKSFRVASDGTANFDGNAVFGQDLDASSGTFKMREFHGTASVDSTQIADGEAVMLVDDQTGGSSSSATLQFRSGATSYQWGAIDATLR